MTRDTFPRATLSVAQKNKSGDFADSSSSRRHRRYESSHRRRSWKIINPMKNGGRDRRTGGTQIGSDNIWKSFSRQVFLNDDTPRPVLDDTNHRRLIIGNFTARLPTKSVISREIRSRGCYLSGCNITLRRLPRADRARGYTVAPVCYARVSRELKARSRTHHK